MRDMGRAFLVCMGAGLALIAIVWSIEYALGAPEGVYGVSELVCGAIAILFTLHRYETEILGPRPPRG
jgi:hypothetical protein